MEINFQDHPGWHVFLGDNGSGKSSIIRSVALALVGKEEIHGIKPNWNEWLKWKKNKGHIIADLVFKNKKPVNITYSYLFERYKDRVYIEDLIDFDVETNKLKRFSAGFGPFRRFTGGSHEMDRVFSNPSYERLAAHLSLFGEDVALTEATSWLSDLQFKTLEQSLDESVLEKLVAFINSPDFLPHNSKLKEISSQGVFFIDGNGSEITVNQMSDGYRSILSLTFELLRQMVKVFGEKAVFKKVAKGEMVIDVPGIVLIDEVDAHLHPVWQTRIGEWFLKYFPKIQFIVTTHSPLICRAAEKGSIWRLAAPGSEDASGEITGLEKERIIYGNVLDAFGTEVFGKSPVRSEKSNEKLERLGRLNMLSALGKIKKDEEKERQHLQKILKTDDPTGY